MSVVRTVTNDNKKTDEHDSDNNGVTNKNKFGLQ